MKLTKLFIFCFLSLFFSIYAQAQDLVVKGKVYDDNGYDYMMPKAIKAETLVIRDPITKNQESVDLKSYAYDAQSKALIKLLKFGFSYNKVNYKRCFCLYNLNTIHTKKYQYCHFLDNIVIIE